MAYQWKEPTLRPAIVIACAALLLAACNLSDNVPTGPETLTPPVTPTDASAEVPPTADSLPTALPGVLPLQTPGVLPTRTPFGAPAPTTLPVIGQPSAPDAVPTSPTGESAVVSSPANGANVPVGVLQVSGRVIGLPRDEFDLVLTDGSGQVLNTQHITLQNPNNVAEVPWSASMTTGSYTGPATVEVVGVNALDQRVVLARVQINLTSGAASNPGSVPAAGGVSVGSRSTVPVASINSPARNMTVTDPIQVTGAAGGIADNQFVIVLLQPDGIVLNSQLVTLTNDDYTSVVPWSVALGTSGYRGPAEIRAFTTVNNQQITLTNVPITVQ